MKTLYILLVSFSTSYCYGQQDYVQVTSAFQKNYVATHEIIKGADKKFFRFFKVDSNYKVTGSFEKINDAIGCTMKTSNNGLQAFYKYGKITFTIRDTVLHLYVYQSKDLMKTRQYADYLFVPFTDLTTGRATYGSGRYLDITIPEISHNTITLDFNRAYNPYCAYAAAFQCPIPPKENFIPLLIEAGEMNFAKAH